MRQNRNDPQNKTFGDNFSKGVEIKLKPQGDCVAQAFFLGQITGGTDFKSSDGLFCEVILEVGKKWNMIRGAQQRNDKSQNSFKSIQTQTAYAEEGQMHVWSHPIDLEFKVESIDGWPKGIMKIWRLDDTNKIDVRIVNFPKEEGYHKLEVETWSPMGDWRYSNFTFFLGTQPRLSNLDISKYFDSRDNVLGVSNGKVTIEIEVMLRNFDIIDVTGQNLKEEGEW